MAEVNIGPTIGNSWEIIASRNPEDVDNIKAEAMKKAKSGGQDFHPGTIQNKVMPPSAPARPKRK